MTGVQTCALPISRQLAERIPHAEYCAESEEVIRLLRKRAETGDVIVVMGAGNISRLADEITKKEEESIHP